MNELQKIKALDLDITEEELINIQTGIDRLIGWGITVNLNNKDPVRSVHDLLTEDNKSGKLHCYLILSLFARDFARAADVSDTSEYVDSHLLKKLKDFFINKDGEKALFDAEVSATLVKMFYQMIAKPDPISEPLE